LIKHVSLPKKQWVRQVDMFNPIILFEYHKNIPVNCGATVPRVSFEKVIEANIGVLYCSRVGSTEVFISSDAA